MAECLSGFRATGQDWIILTVEATIGAPPDEEHSFFPHHAAFWEALLMLLQHLLLSYTRSILSLMLHAFTHSHLRARALANS